MDNRFTLFSIKMRRCRPAAPAPLHGVPFCWQDRDMHRPDREDRILDQENRRSVHCGQASLRRLAVPLSC